MRFFCISIFSAIFVSFPSYAVKDHHKTQIKEVNLWAYDSLRERAESQIRIRRLQYMLDQQGSIEAEHSLLEAMKLENARR